MLALHIGSTLRVIPSLATFRRRECFLYTSIRRSLPWMRVLHHMSGHNCLSINSSAYHPLWVSFKCCAPLFLLSSFPLTLSRGLSALSEYLTMSDCAKLSSSCPMNSEIDCNHISMMVDWTDRVGLTDNSNGLCRKRVVSWLWILDGVSRKGVTTQSCDTDHRNGCLGNLDMSREFDHWHRETDIGITLIKYL